MSSSSPSPSHRSPLTLLSKLKRQLSKASVIASVIEHRKQPIEHQYLPIPTVSFSESLYSNRALSTYSCSNNSSASFFFIDEEPGSSAVDEYRPFVPLVIQHERLQQRLASRVAPQRTRLLPPLPPPPPNDPPSPTSTASSKGPVTPTSFLDEEEDGIMTLNSSEVGSISEYSLPRSLSAYMDARSIHSRRGKSGYQTSSDSESRHATVTGTSARRSSPPTLFPPISLPPSVPSPEPPKPIFTVTNASDGESASSHSPGHLANESTPPPPLSFTAESKGKARSSILSDLEIFDSAISPYQLPDGDEFFTAPSTTSSLFTPTTPTLKQYGIGRQVISGSGTGRNFGPDFGPDSSADPKRLSVIKRKSFGPESSLKDKHLVDEAVQTNTAPAPTQTQSPPPPQRRRAKSNDSKPIVNASTIVSRRATHREKPREKIHQEWTLFLGIPRNAAPPPPPPPSTGRRMSSTGELNINHASTTTTGKSQYLPTHFPPLIRNRTQSDSALLARASTSASGDETETKTKANLEGEDWTLSLPLVVPSTTPLSASPAEVPRGSKTLSGSGPAQVEVVEGSRVGGEGLVITVEDTDDRQQGKEKRQVRVQEADVDEEEDQDSLILRVPRIVRSCSSVPVLSSPSFPAHTNNTNMNGRTKKGSTKRTIPPHLQGLSFSKMEEVMLMLLGDEATDSESKTRSRTSSSSSAKTELAPAVDLAQKKRATLDEDLARFNALLMNGSLNRSESRPASMVIETALAAAAAAATKTKTVALNSHSDPIRTRTPSTPPLLIRKKSTPNSKPPCEFFLESSVLPFPLPPPPSMGPVKRFPSSTRRGDLNFFDELGEDIGNGSRQLTQARLRSTRSAEWPMGDVSMPLGLSAAISTLSMHSSSARASSSSSPLRQHRITRSNSPPTTSTQTLLLPFASSSTLKSKRSLRFESRRGDVLTMPFQRTVSMGSLSHTTVPVESSLGFPTSHKGKEQPHYHHQKRSPPTHLPRLHTSSVSSSSSSASSTSWSQPHITISIDDSLTPDYDTNDTLSACPSPSPIQSESSSALPTPLASAFPLPPSSAPISISKLDGVAFQKKLKEFESAREQQQQRKGNGQYLQYKPPSTTSSVCSLASNASSTATVVPSGDQKMRMCAAAGATGDGGGRVPVVQERGGERETAGDTQEDDEDSMCSSTYYSARSCFSQEQL